MGDRLTPRTDPCLRYGRPVAPGAYRPQGRTKPPWAIAATPGRVRTAPDLWSRWR